MNGWLFDPEKLTIKTTRDEGWQRLVETIWEDERSGWSTKQIRDKAKKPQLSIGGLISKDTLNAIIANGPKCDISPLSDIEMIFKGDKKMKYMLPEI